MGTSDSLSNALGIEYKKTEIQKVEPEVQVVEEPPVDPNLEDQKEDYRLSRNTFRDLITKGNGAIEDLTDLAKESESPRAYEVLATLMKTVAETTKDLYDLQKKTKDLKTLDAPGKKVLDNGAVNIDKAVFVGTTTELLKSLKEKDTNG